MAISMQRRLFPAHVNFALQRSASSHIKHSALNGTIQMKWVHVSVRHMPALILTQECVCVLPTFTGTGTTTRLSQRIFTK
jgi:hypothetical protein